MKYSPDRIRNALKLYLVTDRRFLNLPEDSTVEDSFRELCDVVVKAVQGGVTMVQLREKDLCTRDFILLGKMLKKALEPYGVPLLVNDRVDVALACGADGVHVGQEDMPVYVVRQLMGPDAIIGLSVENLSQLEDSNKQDADYIGISPVFDTNTKTDTKTAFGLDGVRSVCSASLHPSVGIGGINKSNAGSVIAAGADGVAVVSAIMASQDPEIAARQLL